MRQLLLLGVLGVILMASGAQGDVPNTISYQGILADADGGVVDNGDYNLHFYLYEAETGGTAIWDENHNDVNVVNVYDGRFDVILGSITSFASVAFDQPYWLAVTVNGSAELPRIEMASSAYSLNARSVMDNAVTSAKIADGAIQLSDIGQNGATTNQVMKWSGSAWTAQDDVTGSGPSDHGSLDGLDDDDHPQYLHRTGATQFVTSIVGFGDSTMMVSNNTVVIGNHWTGNEDRLVNIERHYNTNSLRTGIDLDIENLGGGAMEGIYSSVENNGSGGELFGVIGRAIANGTSGETRGVKGVAYNSNVAIGIYGYATGGAYKSLAGKFNGDVDINGTLTKDAGSFLIDHPLDPGGKYLQHSFVESPDMMNVYNGNVTLEDNGRVTVELPDYFEALNMEFRYQLTPIGSPGPNLFISREISGNSFEISGGETGMKVSWQVTGIRHDAYAEAHRIPVEFEKPSFEQGLYRHPELYGFDKDRAIDKEPHLETESESRH
ncbi:MAG: hypothetical protein KAW46_06330 [candidate division Zixibacteria bacterium]|nr:hypothetical protein [candidate division Zixibacteria bacterium]